MGLCHWSLRLLLMALPSAIAPPTTNEQLAPSDAAVFPAILLGEDVTGPAGTEDIRTVASLCSRGTTYIAGDNCSRCECSWDGRMGVCSRETCVDPGNYTEHECVEHALYLSSDGCNRCVCDGRRRFDHCTRFVCLESMTEDNNIDSLH